MVELIDILLARRCVRTGEAQKLREAAGLSRSDIARTLDVDASAVGRWERHEREPRGGVARRYGQLLRQLEMANSGTRQ